MRLLPPVDGQDDVDRSRLWHVPCATWRLDGDTLWVETGFLRLTEAETRAGDHKIEDAEDRRTEHARKSRISPGEH